MKLFEHILNLLFPPKCPFCGRILSAPDVCTACRSSLPCIPLSEQLQKVDANLRCAAPLWYKNEVRHALLRFKFQGSVAAAQPLGKLIAQCAAESFSGEFDTVTWVPVSKKRLRSRGFDQSRLLAESACRLWDTKPVRLLEKCVDTPPQSSLSDAAARRANVLGAYETARDADIVGKRILLIDDICTTGATLAECARVLRHAGAENVVCATVALTPSQGGKRPQAGEE